MRLSGLQNIRPQIVISGASKARPLALSDRIRWQAGAGVSLKSCFPALTSNRATLLIPVAELDRSAQAAEEADEVEQFGDVERLLQDGSSGQIAVRGRELER